MSDAVPFNGWTFDTLCKTCVAVIQDVLLDFNAPVKIPDDVGTSVSPLFSRDANLPDEGMFSLHPLVVA